MKVISNQLSPNFPLRRAAEALVQGFQGGRVDFENIFGTSNFILGNTARTTLGVLADTLQIPKDKQIALPAFTCGVVATPFLERGYRICWIDTDPWGVMNPQDLEKKINQVGLVIAIHTFGQTAPLEQIYKLTQEKGIPLIADGAHRFETNIQYCNGILLSFGREKDVSCVSGGTLLWKNPLPSHTPLPNPSAWWTARHLLQPLLINLCLGLWYTAGPGKALALLLGKLKLIPRAVTQAEKQGKEDIPEAGLSPALQRVLHLQLLHRPDDLKHRKEIAATWETTLKKCFPNATIKTTHNAFRVILKTSHKEKILRKAAQHGFLLREWDGIPISPAGINLEAFGYTTGQCPHAEKFAREYITFPTNIRTTVADVQRFQKLFIS